MLLFVLQLLVLQQGIALSQTLALRDDLPISSDGRIPYLLQTAAVGRLPDLPRSETLRTLGELPIVLCGGKLDVAKEMFQKVLEIREKTLGKEHVHTLATVDDLANIAMNQGNFTDAFMKYEYVAKAKAKALGNQHPATLTAFHNLAVAWSAQVSYPSPPLPQHILKHLHTSSNTHSQRKMNIEKHSIWTNVFTDSLGGDGNGFKEVNETELYRQVKNRRVEVLGVDHPDTLQTALGLADAMHDLHNFDQLSEAKNRYGVILQAQEAVLGPLHVDVLATVEKMANVLVGLNEWVEAKEMYIRSMSGRERSFGT